MNSKKAELVFVVVATALAASPVTAKTRHRSAPRLASQSASTGRSFYPNEIEGGVKGNLTFNNQIRKHTDPLNANGGR